MKEADYFDEQEKDHLSKVKEEYNEQGRENPLIDQIINKRGYSWEVWKVIILSSLTLLIEGIHLGTFSVIFTPFQNLYKLSHMEVSLISSLIFVTVGIGSIFVGYLGSKFRRTHIIIFGTCSIFVFTLLIGFIENVYVFTVFRCFIGFFLGLNVPILMCVLTECLPQFFRSFVLVSVWVTFALGVIYLISLAAIFMPNQEASGTLTVLSLMSIPPFFTAIVYMLFLEDSSRNLILQSRTEEGFKLLEKMIERPLSVSEKDRILKEVVHGENERYSTGDICSLLKPNIRSTTIFLMFIWIINSIICYTPMIIMSITLKKLGSFDPNRSVYLQLMIVNIISLFGCFIAGGISEIKNLGRKYSVVLGFGLFSLAAFISTFLPKYFEIFLGLEGIFVNVAFNIIGAYSCEFYPTKIRETANGFLFFSTRIGGFSSQFLGVGLDRIATMLPYYVISGLAVVGAILTVLLPHDTQNHHLDVDLDQEEIQMLKKQEEEEA